ncbi:hypothetical protein C0992_007704 [Termitomyces sp. T32_za158]|nr:hypothetical protein C0992_007704 [Termitomyces sp. T32_za158]
MARTIRASVVQTCSARFSIPDTLAKLEQLTRLARDRDRSQLCVFPEAFIGGYPKFSTFGTSVGTRADAGRDEFARYYAGAIEVPSPALMRIEEVSRETGVFLVVGIIERDLGTLYCTVVFVDPERGYVGKHRKLMPTAMERIVWGQGDGSTLPVLEKKFMNGEGEVDTRMSATICCLGTELYCAPTVDDRPQWQSTMHHIALEGGCFVLAACQYAEAKDFPDEHFLLTSAGNGRLPEPNTVMLDGGSVIISPLGKILAGPLRNAEGVLTAELDLDDVARKKFDLDVVGHYARNDGQLWFSFNVLIKLM